MTRRLLASLALALFCATPGAASAQPSATSTPSADESAETRAAADVHFEGGYPDDIIVLDDDSDASHRSGDEGAGDGPHGRIGVHGSRDGGDPQHSLDLPVPDAIRAIFDALGRLLGAAAGPIGYLLLAIGIAIVIALLVYLVVMLRIPKPDLRATSRRDAGTAGAAVLDPLLEDSKISAEELAAAGRFREAVHALFLRALRAATRSADVDRRGRTAREVVALVVRAHGDLPPLRTLLALTEVAWFGGREVTEGQYLEARALASEVETRAPTLGPAPIGAPA